MATMRTGMLDSLISGYDVLPPERDWKEGESVADAVTRPMESQHVDRTRISKWSLIRI